jgi:hypothetical protein
MSNDVEANNELPEHLEGLVPSAEQVLRALDGRIYTYEVETEFIRAVDNKKHVATASPFKAHRFGPPLELVRPDGTLEFSWLYLARDSVVASWESQLVLNNRGAGSGFHITRRAVEHGVIARVRFVRPLRLWNLGEDHSSRLGIHDIVSSGDHEACQWLGRRIRQAMLTVPADRRPDGFVYPSRRVKGFPALEAVSKRREGGC